MDLFATQKKFIDSLESEIRRSMREAVNQFGFVIKDFIVNKQLFREGIDGTGQRLPGYRRTTIRVKITKGQPVDRTTLLDEGDFYASIQVDAYQDRFEISSNVTHDKYIVKRYGPDVLRPTKENMEHFMKVYFLPKLKSNVNNKFTR